MPRDTKVTAFQIVARSKLISPWLYECFNTATLFRTSSYCKRNTTSECYANPDSRYIANWNLDDTTIGYFFIVSFLRHWPHLQRIGHIFRTTSNWVIGKYAFSILQLCSIKDCFQFHTGFDIENSILSSSPLHWTPNFQQ
jgi:hypothetical protein